MAESPINIKTKEASPVELEPLCYKSLFECAQKTTVKNTGATVEVTLSGKACMAGGPLKEPLPFASMHFHWGENDQFGSEHAFDCQKYAMEMHLVFMKTASEDDKSGTEASSNSETAVVSVLFKACKDAPDYKVFCALENIKECPGTTACSEVNVMTDFKCVLRSDDYYTYKGKMTDPPFCNCNQWIIYRHILPIKSSDLCRMRSLAGNDGPIKCNWKALAPQSDDLCVKYVLSNPDQSCPEKE